MSTFMAYAGGIPTFISLGFFLIMILFLSKKKSISFKKLKSMRVSAKLANTNYYEIKDLLKKAKPLVRFRFMLLVGSKRWKDYNYQG